MAGSYTGGPSEVVASTNFVQTAYDRMAYFALRPELYFDQVADVRATNQAMPGNVVKFTIVNDLPIAAGALSETDDLTPVSFSDSQVSVSLVEYGNALVTSAKLRGTAFVDVDPVVANLIGYNAGVSLDTIARSVLDSGTQVAYVNSRAGRTSIQQASSDILTSTDIRTARARLRSQNVPTFGGAYVGFIHPDTVVDIQAATDVAGWRQPHIYSAPSEIWSGDLGQYEGIRWIETPRAPVFEGGGSATVGGGSLAATTATVGGLANGVFTAGASGIVTSGGVTTVTGSFVGTTPAIGAALTSLASNASVTGTISVTDVTQVTLKNGTQINLFTASGTGTISVPSSSNAGVTIAVGANVYGTIIVGRQSLAKAHAMADGNGPFPSVVPGPVTDLLRRHVPLGWYWLGGYSIFRQASVYRIEHATTLGADLATSFNPGINEGETGNPQA